MGRSISLAYVCADSTLKDFVSCSLHAWIQSCDLESFDMIDDYTTENYDSEKVVEHKKKFNKADLFFFVLESDVGPRIWNRVIAEYKLAIKKEIPIVIIRYDANPGDQWINAPRIIFNGRRIEVAREEIAVKTIIQRVLRGEI